MANAWWEPLEFVVPATRAGQVWERVVDTYEPSAAAELYAVSDGVTVHPRSVVVLQRLA